MHRLKSVVLLLSLAGFAAANNLILNGNFSLGNVDFSSAYSFVAANGTVQTGPGDYGLTTNPSTGFTNGYNSYTDHTGDAAGLMMLVDGLGAGSTVWSEVISVSPSTMYNFTGFVASADDLNLATLALFVNGTEVPGSSFAAPSTAGFWSEWDPSFTTGSLQTSITLSIQDLNTQPYVAGNDFSLDDLSLTGPSSGTSGVPEPSSFIPLVAGLWLMRTAAQRKKAVQR